MALRSLAPLVVVALAMGCAGRMPVTAPPGLGAVRFGLAGAVRLRVLTEEDVGREKPPHVIVAEDRSELESAWDELGLKGGAPAVDFAAELVLFFSENGFCNDGTLRAIALTTSGDLVPEVHRSGMACNLIGYECGWSRIYALALPRQHFKSGWYRWRNGPTPEPFELGVGAAGAYSTPPSASGRLALPTTPEPKGPRHARRARITFDGLEDEYGVWVSADAVWLPPSRERDEIRRAGWTGGIADVLTPVSVCDDSACRKVLASGACVAPECPTYGELLFTDGPLTARGPWPSEPVAWERLMDELSRDPALNDALAARRPFPVPPPEPKPGWAANRFRSQVVEAALLGATGTELTEPGAFGGGELRLGLRFNRGISDTTTTGYVLEPLLGDSLGADLRFYARYRLDAPLARYGAGIALAADNQVGRSTVESRFRIASVLALLVPEIGFIGGPRDPWRFYLSSGLPMSALVTEQLAIELHPALTLRLAPEREGGKEAVASLALGLSWRFPHSRCP